MPDRGERCFSKPWQPQASRFAAVVELPAFMPRTRPDEAPSQSGWEKRLGWTPSMRRNVRLKLPTLL